MASRALNPKPDALLEAGLTLEAWDAQNLGPKGFRV